MIRFRAENEYLKAEDAVKKIETEIATKIQPCLEKKGGVCYNQ